MSAPSMTMTMIMNNNNNNNKVQNQDEETMMVMKQGIITILDSNSNTVSSPLRRAISADMSSKNWLSQNIKEEVQGSHDIKTIGGSKDDEERNEEVEDEDEDEAERERLAIWSSIQRNKKEEQEKSEPFDTWSSIMSIKGKDEISKSLPASPYVHPLMKRTKSCLSEKSLEICTESLGSETGSDGLLFSPYPSSSETGEAEEQEKEEKALIEPDYQEEEKEHEEEQELCNYASVVTTTKKASASPTRAFPPPLPSLSNHSQANPSLHMRPHRDNGRLVLEAVSVPSNNNFNVQRQDGRLVLTFSNQQEEEEVEEEENDDLVEDEYLGGFEFEENEDYDEEDEVGEEEEYFFDTKPQVSSTGDNSGLIGYESVMEKGQVLSKGVASLALMMNKNKPIGLVNRNPKWSEKFNEMNNFGDDSVNVAQSLPPRPRVARLIPSSPAVAAAASFNFNAYEYYWRTKSATPKGTSVNLNPLDQENMKSKVVVSRDMNKVSSEQLLVLRGKNGDYLVHNLKSCKDSRRSFLFWEPYCIATS